MEKQPHVLRQDESGHWYLIPNSQRETFSRLLKVDLNEFEEKFGSYRVNPYQITIYR